jgi:succinate dehydrogenase/fumarate reductase flavoprotein subunit
VGSDHGFPEPKRGSPVATMAATFLEALLQRLMEGRIPCKLCSRPAIARCMMANGNAGRAVMQSGALTGMRGGLLALLVLASSNGTAWARHYRVVADPCPDRCNAKRLTLCSSCMGGIKTCAQQYVCNNNRGIACGEASTVTVHCLSPPIPW